LLPPLASGVEVALIATLNTLSFTIWIPKSAVCKTPHRMPPPTLTSARVAPDGQPPVVRISTNFESGRREKALAAIAVNSAKASAKAAQPQTAEHTTRVNNADPKALSKSERNEAIRYFSFVVLFGVSAFINVDAKFFWFRNAVSDIFLTQDAGSVVSRESFWDYATNSDPGGFLSNFFSVVDRMDNPTNSSLQRANNIFLISPLRIRTLRVTPGPCFPKGFNSANLTQIFDASRTCNPPFIANVENKLDYQNFSWSVDPVVNRNLIGDFGELAFYPSGGYVVTINANNASSAGTFLRNLQHSGFLDGTSSFVALEFNVFAPIAMAYLPARIYFEFPSIGGAILGTQLSPTIMFRYATAQGQIIQGIDAALIVYFILALLKTIKEMWNTGAVNFFKLSKWNTFDLVCHISLMVNLGLRFNMNKEAQALNLADATVFTEISQFVVYERSITAANAFTLLLVLIRVGFYYGKHFPKAALIITSCEYALSNLIICAGILLVTFLAFTSSFYVCFGAEVGAYRSFGLACLAMLKALMGNTDDMVTIPSAGFPIIGPILIVSYALCMYFVLINLFVAILVDSFIATKASWNQQEKLAQIKKLAIQKSHVGSLRKKFEEDFSDDDIIDREELQSIVDTYKDLLGINTVEEFLERYDDNHDGVITRAELMPLQEKLDRDLAIIMEGGDIKGALTSEGMLELFETFDQSIDEKLESLSASIMRAIEQRSFGGGNSAKMGMGFEGGQGVLPVQNRTRDLLSQDTFAATLIGTVKAKSQFMTIKKRCVALANHGYMSSSLLAQIQSKEIVQCPWERL